MNICLSLNYNNRKQSIFTYTKKNNFSISLKKDIFKINLLLTLISAYYLNIKFSVKAHTSISIFLHLYAKKNKVKEFVSILNLIQNSNFKKLSKEQPDRK